MTDTTGVAIGHAPRELSDEAQRGNIARLSIAQALAGANSVVAYATGAIVGNSLAPDSRLATLPLSIFVVGMAASILPVGAIARHHGRRTAFLVGTGAGILAGLLATLAVLESSFWLFCVATFLGGAYAAVVLSFRFAAADGVDATRRARAVSLVMAGGVAAGVLGPQLVTLTMDAWPPYTFAATYIAQAAVALLSMGVLVGVRLPKPTAAEIAGGRPLAVVARQPRFITAVICGAVSYMLMNFLMTAAPLAMKLCGLSQQSANLGIQWHVIAMYGPSFFTGRLITRFGASLVVAGGLVLMGVSALVGLAGIDVAHFWLTLVLLGVGWNFSFIGASTLVLESHRPDEKTRVQALNDFIVFGLMTIGSFVSGSLLSAYGWSVVLSASFLPLAIAVVALMVTTRVHRATEGARA